MHKLDKRLNTARHEAQSSNYFKHIMALSKAALQRKTSKASEGHWRACARIPLCRRRSNIPGLR